MSVAATSDVGFSTYGPPAPQSSSRSYDRLKALEAAILLRKNEVDTLRLRHKQLLQHAHQRAHATAGLVALPSGGSSGNNSDQQPQHPALSRKRKDGLDEDPDDPLNIPIVKLCTGDLSTFSMFQVPPERFGDTCIELEVATDSINRHAAITQRQIAELELQSRGYEKDQAQLTTQIRLMAELTGMPIAAASLRTAAMTDRHLKRNAEDAKTSTAPGYKMLRAMEESNGNSPTELKQKNDDLRKYIQTLTKETRAAKAVMLKKERAIRELAAQLDGKKQLEESTLQLYNDIRVKDREVRERKRDLRAILEEHERLDHLIGGAANAKAASSVAIMDGDLAMIKAKIVECVEDERRLQDRISKAQEYRISILNRRIQMILDCVKSHKLDDDVEALIAATLELQRQQDLVGAEQFNQKQQSSSKRSAGVASAGGAASSSQVSRTASGVGGPRRAAAASSSSSSANILSRKPNIVTSGQLVIAQASHKQAAQEIATLRREELYDIDTIIPPNETIHPAIYSLFVSEKETLAKRAVTTKLIAEEKMAAVEALTAKGSGLDRNRAAIDEQLQRTERSIKAVESQKKLDLLEEVTANRTLLQQAMAENVSLSRLAKEKAPVAAIAKEECERRELRRATGGYASSSTPKAVSPSGTPSAQSLQGGGGLQTSSFASASAAHTPQSYTL